MTGLTAKRCEWASHRPFSLGGRSILESVIKQTGAYAASRKGRLSVFWGDQVFIPSVSLAYTPDSHVDILCTLGPMANEVGGG